MPIVRKLIGGGISAGAASAMIGSAGATTAAGTTAGTATVLAYINNVVTTAGGATGVILPSGAGIGDSYTVYVTTATTALIYPPSGGNIGGNGVDTGVTVLQDTMATFTRLTNVIWTYLV